MRTLTCVLGAVLLFVPVRVAGDDSDRAKEKEALDAFTAYLKKDHPNKKYQTGPSRLDSAAVKAAYGERRFYFVFSRPPLAPGANVKSVQEAHRRQVEDFRKNYVSITARVTDKLEVIPLLKPEDFNVGLMTVASEADAKTAAAAILSLFGSGQNGPGAVEAKEVSVTKHDKGWTCKVDRRNAFHGTVAFDTDGAGVGVSKAYAGLLPK